MRELEDKRSLAFPDQPYSAYCRQCWCNVYVLWIDANDDPRGRCVEGASSAAACTFAQAHHANVASVRKALDDDRGAT